ncbi:MAG: hypothetical protein KC420_03580 [Myxococcales bacterium]|nr:hypothetical protein [Myxococcales bacterium]
MLRPLARSLLALTGLAASLSLTLAPTDADACSTGEEWIYEVHMTYPAEGAIDVPVDGAIAVHGTSNLAGELKVEVNGPNGVVPGTLENKGGRLFWRPDAPFDPLADYVAHLWTEDPISGDNLDQLLAFTTAEESAPPIAAPSISISLSKYNKEYTKCVAPPEPGDCSDCGAYEVIKVEERIRLNVSFEHPGGPFGDFYLGHERHGASEAEVAEGASHESGWLYADEATTTISDDLGLVGSWAGDEVCVRAWVWDPRGIESEAVIACAPIGDANVPTPASDTDTDGDTDGGTDTDTDIDTGAGPSGDAGSSTDGDPSESGGQGGEGDDVGCGCRSTNNVQGGAAFFLGLLLAWARGRRRRGEGFAA